VLDLHLHLHLPEREALSRLRSDPRTRGIPSGAGAEHRPDPAQPVTTTESLPPP
jgi:hypothetical protein